MTEDQTTAAVDVDPELAGVALEHLVRAGLLRTKLSSDPAELPEGVVFFALTDKGFEIIARRLSHLREESEEIGLLIPGERPNDGAERAAYGVLVQALVNLWLTTCRALFFDGVQDVATFDAGGLAADLGFDHEWCAAIEALRARGLKASARDCFDRAEVMGLQAKGWPNIPSLQPETWPNPPPASGSK